MPTVFIFQSASASYVATYSFAIFLLQLKSTMEVIFQDVLKYTPPPLAGILLNFGHLNEGWFGLLLHAGR